MMIVIALIFQIFSLVLLKQLFSVNTFYSVFVNLVMILMNIYIN